jgi:hypothetical protein
VSDTPFETKRIVTSSDEYLVQVKYAVERRQIVTIPEGKNGKKVLTDAEQSMRAAIIQEIAKELGGEVFGKKK